MLLTFETVKRLQHHRDVSPHGNLRPADSDVQPFPFPKQSFDFSLHAKSENAYPLYVSSLSQSMNHRLRIQLKDSSSTWFVNPVCALWVGDCAFAFHD
ncbi:unnamed protein product [Microthlaspi erraticum]|uniref:Uncharacterized protein n=1 Tax=Microthlaspi erraticum TaxID=1685480 RepID=A0A6D2LE33_9BRAS|nr:unnamed protein product [Microthlaspi erraticum]